ncbi:MAG: hypothetical protein WCI52_02140 [bacterium]
MSNLEFNEMSVVQTSRGRKASGKKSFIFGLVEKCGVPEKNVNKVLIIIAVLALILTAVVLKVSFSGPQRLTDDQLMQYNKSHAIPRPNSQ